MLLAEGLASDSCSTSSPTTGPVSEPVYDAISFTRARKKLSQLKMVWDGVGTLALAMEFR